MASDFILSAVRYGNRPHVREYINQGNDVNATDARDDNNTLLMIAAKKGWSEIGVMLLEAGADVNRKNKNGATALHFAAHGYFVNFIEKLIQFKANVFAKDNDGNTCLHYISKLLKDDRDSRPPRRTIDTIAMHYANGKMNVDLQNHLGESPLHHACSMGLTEVAGFLLEKGALITAKDDKDETPLHKAVKYPETLGFLLLNENGQSFLNCANKDGDTVLHLASRKGMRESVEKLLNQQELNTEVTNLKGLTALHVASAEGHHNIAMLLATKNKNLLVKTDDKKETFFHLAAREGNGEVIQKLIDFIRADDDAVNHCYLLNKKLNVNGLTPLLVAIETNNNEELVRLLRSAGAKLFPSKDINCISLVLKYLKNNTSILKHGSEELLEETVEDTEQNVIKFLVDNELALKEREELVDLFKTIEDKASKPMCKSKHRVKTIYKSKLETSPGLVQNLETINRKYPITAGKKCVLSFVSVCAYLFGVALYGYDVTTDVLFTRNMYRKSMSSSNGSSCKGDLYEKNFGLQDGFNCSNFDDCKKYINDIHEKMEDCSMKDSRFNETEKHNFYNEIYLISLAHCIILPVVSVLVFVAMIYYKKKDTFRQLLWKFPNPLITKMKILKLNWELYKLESERTDDDEKVGAKKREIENQRDYENFSVILEASLESSFQMWFQAIFLFPLFLFLVQSTYTKFVIMRIFSVVGSFLSTAYSIVFCRNLDKRNTYSVVNIGLMFIRTLCQVVSRTLIVGSYIYISNEGQFHALTTVKIYYGCFAIMFCFNVFFYQENFFDCKNFWNELFEITINSLGSVFSYNNYGLRKMIGKKDQKHHVSQFMKQAIYMTLTTVALICFTVQTVIKAKQEDEIHIYDVNGQKRTLSHEILYRYLICGWAFYVVAMLCNTFFYAVHPSEVDFDQWDDKFKVFVFGKERDWRCWKKPEESNLEMERRDNREPLMNDIRDI